MKMFLNDIHFEQHSTWGNVAVARVTIGNKIKDMPALLTTGVIQALHDNSPEQFKLKSLAVTGFTIGNPSEMMLFVSLEEEKPGLIKILKSGGAALQSIINYYDEQKEKGGSQ